MIPAGTLLTFDVAGSSDLWPHTPEGIRQSALDAMPAYFDERTQISLTTPSFSDDPLRMFKGVQYQAVVQASPLADYGDPHDVASLVRHVFFDAAGALPTVTVRGVDTSIGPPVKETPGINIGMYAGLAVVALVAIAVIVAVK